MHTPAQALQNATGALTGAVGDAIELEVWRSSRLAVNTARDQRLM
jgi:hypothetical protein